MKNILKTIAISLVAIGVLTGCGEEIPHKEMLRPVRAIKLGNVEGLNQRFFPGRAEATQEVNLGFEVAGTLVERLVSKGDIVKKGQLLARLDPRDFNNALNAVKAEMNRARAHRDRIAKAAATGAVAKQELTDANAQVEVASANMKIRAKALEDSRLVAPFDGEISATYVENYQRVQAKQQVLRLLDASRIEFTVNIPESLISYAGYITEAFVKFDALPDIGIPATVKEVGTEASETTRTYPLTLIMEQPEGTRIMPGMAGKAYGKAELPDEAKVKGIQVPVTAVFEDGGKTWVWVVDEKSMTITRREVTTGAMTDFGMMVEGNLKNGEWVVTAGVHFLKEGQKVRILKEKAGEVTS
ncbi:efflux RND transporter periplasmic adaptor subun it [Desulfonema ishimotonii]|uniref:Efflux RND transporter periplasmic adaptor subun it n=1 Tax=Desulfonema ishimotonii TaxID=45657 RepID=A0A401G330_9BACT|nr:efflux RND transporter periplasmic adaptor subunit [Desulfonema ishimotonii]GBC63637.1 efflux RND transporter periplasmic adaptor subun it [Desulfonema ishimotonii]